MEPEIVEFESSGEVPYPLEIKGESFHRASIAEVVADFDRDEEGGVDADELIAWLILDDANEHDPGNAVRIEINGKLVGYLSRTDAGRYRRKLAKLGHPTAAGSCSASVRGGFKLDEGGRADFGVRLDLVLSGLAIRKNG